MKTTTIGEKGTVKIGRRAAQILAAAMLTVCAIGAFIPIAFAAETGELTLTLQQTFFYARAETPPEATFRYRLAAEQPATPMPFGSEAGNYDFSVTGTADESITIGFKTAGVYEYKLSHTTTPASGYTLDQEVYTLRITVNNDLTYTVLVYKADGSKAEEIRYEHSYNAAGSPPDPSNPGLMPELPVIKTVQGNPPKAGTFAFRLTANDPSNPMPFGSVDGTKTVEITGPGQTVFGTWSYTREGVYLYTVSEAIPANAGGYAYDTAVYTVTDTVTAADGQLILSRVVTDHLGKPVTSYSFLNAYRGGGSVSPDGPKTGDASQLTLYAVLFCLASIVLVYLLLGKRRLNNGRLAFTL